MQPFAHHPVVASPCTYCTHYRRAPLCGTVRREGTAWHLIEKYGVVNTNPSREIKVHSISMQDGMTQMLQEKIHCIHVCCFRLPLSFCFFLSSSSRLTCTHTHAPPVAQHIFFILTCRLCLQMPFVCSHALTLSSRRLRSSKRLCLSASSCFACTCASRIF